MCINATDRAHFADGEATVLVYLAKLDEFQIRQPHTLQQTHKYILLMHPEFLGAYLVALWGGHWYTAPLKHLYRKRS